MKESLTALEQFISNFNLRQPNGVVFFNADIHFENNGHSETVQSEIHIITSDNIGALYILNLPGTDLMDMFSVKKQLFTCTAECLKIEADNYIVAITPVK